MPQSFFLYLSMTILVVWSSLVRAQVPQQNAVSIENEHQEGMPSVEKSLSEQIENLSHQVSVLQAKVSEQGLDTAAMKANGDKHRLKISMGMPGGDASQIPGMSSNDQIGAAAAQAPKMGMMEEMMSMMNSMMGGMGGKTPTPAAPIGQQAASMAPSNILSILPGFPGTSYLYHIGSTNFFLDQHLLLSPEQQNSLADIRMKAIMRQSDFNRRIREVEEQLWLFIASDQPNFSSVEAKIRESEKLQGDSRLAFIKDVGEATNLLSDEQRKALLEELSSPTQIAPNIAPALQVVEDM